MKKERCPKSIFRSVYITLCVCARVFFCTYTRIYFMLESQIRFMWIIFVLSFSYESSLSLTHEISCIYRGMILAFYSQLPDDDKDLHLSPAATTAATQFHSLTHMAQAFIIILKLIIYVLLRWCKYISHIVSHAFYI